MFYSTRQFFTFIPGLFYYHSSVHSFIHSFIYYYYYYFFLLFFFLFFLFFFHSFIQSFIHHNFYIPFILSSFVPSFLSFIYFSFFLSIMYKNKTSQQVDFQVKLVLTIFGLYQDKITCLCLIKYTFTIQNNFSIKTKLNKQNS